jgi:hypothetical protein
MRNYQETTKKLPRNYQEMPHPACEEWGSPVLRLLYYYWGNLLMQHMLMIRWASNEVRATLSLERKGLRCPLMHNIEAQDLWEVLMHHA